MPLGGGEGYLPTGSGVSGFHRKLEPGAGAVRARRAVISERVPQSSFGLCVESICIGIFSFFFETDFINITLDNMGKDVFEEERRK